MRLLAVISAVFVSVMLVLGWALPSAQGSLGVRSDGSSPMQIRIDGLDPGSAYASAGGRVGDIIRLDRMPIAQRIAYDEATAGVVVDLAVDRDGRDLQMRVVPSPQPFSRWRLSGIAIFTLAYIALALLVAWKARRTTDSWLILGFLIGLAASGGLVHLRMVSTVPPFTFFLEIVDSLCIGALLASQFLFALSFPPRATRSRAWIAAIGLPVMVVAIGFVTASGFWGVAAFYTPSWASANDVVAVAFAVCTILAVVDGFRSGASEYRIATITAGSTLVLLALMNIADFGSQLMGRDTSWLAPFGWLRYAAGAGMAYAVLRHRLLGLDLAISRAAIFSVVSLCVIALFVVAEWALSLVLEQALGRFGARGETILAGVVALGVGLSARRIHDVVNHRLNRVFFAHRYRALAEIKRFSLETDAATSAQPLIDLTLAVLRRNLDASYVEIYAGTPDLGYALLGEPDAVVPTHLEPDDEMVLRLRRWGESFVVDTPEHVYAGALVCPMVLRGTLYGFVACGSKSDRTPYLPDETDAIGSLAHRVGIAYEWLTRDLALAPS